MKSRAKLRARLERIRAALPPAEPSRDPGPFALDPATVQALIAEIEGLSRLSDRQYGRFGTPGDLNPTEVEELAMLRAKLWERLQIIAPSMEGYGVTELRRDQALFQFGGRRGGPISAHEEKQARIRIMFFQLSPEGLARSRIDKLKDQYVFAWVTPAERAELAQLEAAYPEVAWETSTLVGRMSGSWARIRNESIKEIRLRHQERAKTDPRYL